MKNPIFKKEIRQYARSYRAMWILTAFNLILMLTGLFVYYISFVRTGKQGIQIQYSDILSVYRILAAVEFLLTACFVPAVSAGSICGEREKQTLDLLISTPLTPVEIVFGKLGASLYIVFVLLLSSLPVFGLVFSVGGITVWDMAELYLWLIVQALIFGSISIFFSACCKKTTTAGVVSYLTLFFLMCFTLLFVMMGYTLSVPENEYASLEAVYRGWISEKASSYDWNLLLLFNPFVSFFALLKEQTGEITFRLLEYGSREGTAAVIREHFAAVSMGLQLVAAFILNVCSIRKLGKLK